MSLHSEEKQREIRRAIQDAIAVDPMVSALKVQNHLFKAGFQTHNETPLDYHYVRKMIVKVRQEAIENVDRSQLHEDFAEVKETNRIVRERLIKIAFFSKEMLEAGMTPPTVVEQMNALIHISKMKMSEVAASVDLGLYVKTIEKTKESLPPEQAKLIDSVLVKWGLLPPHLAEKPLKDKNAESKNKKHYKQDELDERRARPRIGSASDPGGSGDHPDVVKNGARPAEG